MKSDIVKDKDHVEDDTNSTEDPTVVGSTWEGKDPLGLDFPKDLERCDGDASIRTDASQCDLEINGGALPHIVMFVGLVFVLVLVVFQIVMIGSSIYEKHNDGPTGKHSDLPFVMEELEAQTITALEYPSSPELQALQWLEDDFKAHRYSKSPSFQRFHMAVM